MAVEVAVVGLGVRGRQWAAAVMAHPAFDLALAIDTDPAARDAAARELGLSTGRTEAALDDAPGSPAAVIVATPPEHHPEACRAALERGLGVLVEKPFALDLAAAVELVDLAGKVERPLLVAQSYRYLRVYRAAKAVVRSGRLGELRQLICNHYRIEPRPAMRGEHGIVWDLGAHHLDAMRDLLDDEPARVLAAGFDDGLSAQVLLEFRGGARATYHATRRSSGHERFEGGKEHYLRVVGSRGTLHVLHRWLVLAEAGRMPRLLRRGPRGGSEESRLLDDFAAALSGAGPAGISGRDNLGTMAILDACARSAAEGRWVTSSDPAR